MNFCKGNNCSRCGACCTPFLPMTKNEVKKVKEYLKKHPDIYNKGLENPIFDKENETAYICCCFYDKKKKECMIYPVRPFICQVYKCNQTEEKIESNKQFAINKAEYNTSVSASIADFRSLIYNDPRLLILGVKHFAKTNDMNLVYRVFKEIGRQDVAKWMKENIPQECSAALAEEDEK